MPPKYSKKTYKPRKAAAKPKAKAQYRQQKLSVATVKKIAKQAVMQTAETKHIDALTPEFQLFHNAWLLSLHQRLTDALAMPPQGVGESQRLGNEIYISGIKIHMQFQTKNDRLNTKFRVVVVKHNPAYGFASYTDWFDSIMNVMVDHVDRGRATKVFDKIYGYTNFNPTNSTDQITFFKSLWLPIKEKYVFRDDGTQDLAFTKNIYTMFVMAYDATGSLLTDNIGSVVLHRRLYYKDV